MRAEQYTKTGWPFMPIIRDQGAQMECLTYLRDIQESLHILFTTLPGERVGQPLYGCDLIQYMFKPISNSLFSDLDDTITTAITLYEPRIEILDLIIQENEIVPYQIDIELVFMISKTSSRYNMTIPFYIMEGFAEI